LAKEVTCVNVLNLEPSSRDRDHGF
jgi:hypothetical protein